MRTLITTDLHLTVAALDEYRWELFSWLHEIIQKEEIDSLFLLGDLTDAKDRHSSKLVNRIVRCLCELADVLESGGVHILKGNHDYMDSNWPFFGFLSRVPRIWYYSEPRHFTWEDSTYTFLPHCKAPEEEWNRYARLLRKSDYVFIHATAKGAEVSNGFTMPEGLDPNYFCDFDCEVFSGDIHVPQGPACSNERAGSSKNKRRGTIRYVGSPYRIRFGDNYGPRVCILDSTSGAIDSLDSPIDMWKGEVHISAAEDLYDEDLSKGDQIKVVLKDALLYENVEAQRKMVRLVCKKLGVELCSLRLESVSRKTPRKRSTTERKGEGELLLEYAEQEGIAFDVMETGLELLP